jgi:hypothetical protein
MCFVVIVVFSRQYFSIVLRFVDENNNKSRMRTKENYRQTDHLSEIFTTKLEKLTAVIGYSMYRPESRKLVI